MSIPLTSCMISRATQTEEEYQILKRAMIYNKECGHYSQFNVACFHKPECTKPTKEEIDKLNERLKEDVK